MVTITLHPWKGGECHGQLEVLRIARAERGIELNVVNDVREFRASIVSSQNSYLLLIIPRILDSFLRDLPAVLNAFYASSSILIVRCMQPHRHVIRNHDFS